MENKYIAIEQEQLNYVLKRSKKRKRSLSMRYNREGQLQINVPFATTQAVINDFIWAKYNWIKTQQQRISQHQPPLTLPFSEQAVHYVKGESYGLKLLPAKVSEVFLQQGNLLVLHKKNASIENILTSWYKQQAVDYLSQRTHLLAQKHNFPTVREIKVRRMKARWGSCSTAAEITYNTHLIKVSPDCIDYVIVHELCHLIHPNHSAQFYRLQSQINPQWREQKQTLNQFVLA